MFLESDYIARELQRLSDVWLSEKSKMAAINRKEMWCKAGDLLVNDDVI